jgi:hypothetical protein
MAIFKKKKKQIPEELPDLISDDLEKNSKEVHNYLKDNEKSQVVVKNEVDSTMKSPDILLEKNQGITQGINREEQVLNKSLEHKSTFERIPSREVSKSSKEIVSRLVKGVEEEGKRMEAKKVPKLNRHSDKSFFDELHGALVEDLEDVSNVEEWYKEKFSERDMLSDMKDYWEDKKVDSLLEVVSENYRQKIANKVERLQGLEKIWQSIYFELIEKEEEIKESEAELKEILREFVEVCKNKKKSSGKKEVVEEKDEGNEGELGDEKEQTE